MQTTDAIQNWKSIRKWKTDPIPDDIITRLLNAARRAPTWENVQPARFIVVTNERIKDMLKNLAFGQKTLLKAPVVIVCAGDFAVWDREKQKESLMELRDAGAMQATDEIIEKVFLANPAFAPNLRGESILLARTLEQVTYSISFLLVEATNQGLGVCIVGAFGNELTGEKLSDLAEVKTALNLPESCMILTMLCIGYPDESPNLRPRKPLAHIAFRERYGTSWE
jgi:nitroreductase